MHFPDPSLRLEEENDIHHVSGNKQLLRQLPRFGLIGGLNAILDLLVLNGLLWLFPTARTLMILVYTVIAYGVGATNSFLLNKYWTFKRRQRTTWKEFARFAATILFGLGWNIAFISLASTIAHPFVPNTVVWTNVSKIVAMGSTACISFLAMRLWIFVKTPHEEDHLAIIDSQTNDVLPDDLYSSRSDETSTYFNEPSSIDRWQESSITSRSLSVILPVYNEEQVIASTLRAVLNELNAWKIDFEVIVVNDGSMDRTVSVVSTITATTPRVRLVSHLVNQGYGAALVSGFAAATKDLTFFMDADGQFTIKDLRMLFGYIDDYDAVIGYRMVRQDSWIRKLNAWGWKVLIGLLLNVYVRDIDCAFKLFPTAFFHDHPLETRGAMINAELLYKFERYRYCYREVGIHHLPRQGGRATGAKVSVILRAFRELLFYTRKWYREEREEQQKQIASLSERTQRRSTTSNI